MITKKEKTTQTLILVALMMAMIMVTTFIIRIPVPATQGYVHLGDCMIFMAVIILGWKYGAIAAALGSALADIIGGYAFYAPITLVVKGVMAIVAGLFIDWAAKRWPKMAFPVALAGMILGGLTMVVGYYLAESIMYGSFVMPLAAIPMNIVQFVVGIGLALAVSGALGKTPVGEKFAYSVVRRKEA